MFRLEGKIALVTGASRGIGKAIALTLAGAGASVALIARNETLLRQAAEEIEALNRRALPLPADLSNSDSCEEVVRQTHEHFGGLDILVNNAGINSMGGIESITEEDWDRVIATNLKSVFMLCRAATPILRARRWGRIVNIASITAQTGGVSGSVAYSASKGGLLSLTKTLARDLAPAGITVNAIAPGQIETDMGRVAPDIRPELLSRIPLGRLGTPQDIATASLFLCSNEASYITGATLDVNGGILFR